MLLVVFIFSRILKSFLHFLKAPIPKSEIPTWNSH